MTIDVRLLRAADARLLGAVADDVFDKPVRPDQARAFLADPRHHIAAAWVLTEPENTPTRALYRAAGGTESDPVVMVSFRLSEPA